MFQLVVRLPKVLKKMDYLKNFVIKKILSLALSKHFCFPILNPESNATDILLPYGMYVGDTIFVILLKFQFNGILIETLTIFNYRIL